MNAMLLTIVNIFVLTQLEVTSALVEKSTIC